MVESWARELTCQGWATRLFTPSGSWRRSRTDSAVTYRTVRHVGFREDHHARFSSLSELRRARADLPDVVLATTPGRVGTMAVTLAARHGIPLVVVESTDVIGAMAHYNALRMLASGGAKPLVMAWTAPRFRTALWHGLRAAGPGGLDGPGMAGVYAAALRDQADAVVLLSAKSMRAFPEPADLARTVVIPAGIDRLPRLAPPEDLTWRPGSLRVLYVGRLSPEKGLPVLVRGVRCALDRGVDAHLTLVGGGVMTRELITLGQQLGIADRLSVLGPYPRAELGGIYASADVFAFPSVVETQAFVLNEAAHEGLPLLVSDPEINAVAQDGRSALLVGNDPEAYGRGLARLRDAGLRARLGAGARAIAAQFSEAGQAARLSEVLAAAGRRQPGGLSHRALGELDALEVGPKPEPRSIRMSG